MSISFSIPTKRIQRCLYQSCRHQSSSAPSTSRPRTRPAKQTARDAETARHLISLYHKSNTFITLENLSKHIDTAFAGGREIVSATRQEHKGSDIQKELATWRESSPYMTKGAAFVNVMQSDGWMTGKESLQTNEDRHFRLRAALEGADVSMYVGLTGVKKHIEDVKREKAKEERRAEMSS